MDCKGAIKFGINEVLAWEQNVRALILDCILISQSEIKLSLFSMLVFIHMYICMHRDSAITQITKINEGT